VLVGGLSLPTLTSISAQRLKAYRDSFVELKGKKHERSARSRSREEQM
jgi:hypothetical protein